MNPRKAIKELDKQLRRDPNNLVLRIRLAGALCAAGQVPPAVDLYRSVAVAYYAQNRIDQAIAVCHSLLEVAPGHPETELLLAELDSRRAAMSQPLQQAQPPPETRSSSQTGPHGRRRPRRPSGFDSLTPGTSEPDILSPGRVKSDSDPPEPSITGRRGGASGLKRFPLPMVRTVTGPVPAPPRDPGDPLDRGPSTGPGHPSRSIGATATTASVRRFSHDSLSLSPDELRTPPGRRKLALGSPGPERTGRDSGRTGRDSGRVRRDSGRGGRDSGRISAPPPLAEPEGERVRRSGDAAGSRGPVDDEAPTRIADRWIVPLVATPTPTPVGRTGRHERSSEPPPPSALVVPAPPDDPRAGQRDTLRGPLLSQPGLSPSSSEISDVLTNPRRLLGRASSRSENEITLPRRTGRNTLPRGSGGGRRPDSHADEATIYDEGAQLARALGHPFGDTGSGEHSASEAHDLLALAGLPEAAVSAIAAGVIRRRVAAEGAILREGEPGESCFVLSRGEARVLKRDPLHPRGDLIEVARLSDGDLFGEMAMLSDRRRHASVQAVSDCDLLEIPRAHLQVVAQRHAEVAPFLDQFYRDRLIGTLIGTAPFFRPLPPAERSSLVAHFQFCRGEPGTRIVHEGERAGGFYLIVLGTVEITKRVSARRQVLLATLEEGNYFGEMSLMRGDVARASVVATGPVELAMLPAKNFYALVASHPILWHQVRQEAHRRELEMVQIVAGTSGSV